jgi:glutamate racemase
VLQRIRDASANEINAWLGPMTEAERLALPKPVHKALLQNFERQLEELSLRAPRASGDVAGAALANMPEMQRIGKEILFDAGVDLAVSASGEQLKGVGPFLVFLSDSGSGSFVAYPPIRRVLDQAGVDAAIVVTGDHKSGAYGPREQDEIVRLVFNWGGTASAISSADAESLASVLAMACNTACIADFYRQDVRIDFPSDGIPVLNLIDNTAKDVADPANRAIYGSDPVILSTEATRLSGHYPRLVSQYSNGEVTAHNIGGSDKPIQRPDGEMQVLDLATLVNQQAPFDPAREDELAFVISHYVDKFPADMTSLVMCCTHYPALTPQFRRELDRRGMAHVPIINPMPVQGVRILEALAASAEGQETSIGERRVRPDVVVTSADGIDNPGAAPGSGAQTLREGLGAATFTGRELPTFFGHPLGSDFPGQRVADFINGYTGPVGETDPSYFDLRPDHLREPSGHEGRPE